MKKVLLAIALLAGSATAAFAQNNVVKINIFSPIVKTGTVFFEHKLSDASSMQLGLSYTSWDITGDTNIRGLTIIPEYRFYLSESHAAPEGFYVAPFVRYRNFKFQSANSTLYDANGNPYTSTSEATLSAFGAGVLVGHQWLFKKRFSLDTFIGPSYDGSSLSYNTNNGGTVGSTGVFKGFGVRAGLTFGLAF